MKNRTNTGAKAYRVFSLIVITILAIAFAFPLYWIITGSFKTSMAINAPAPQWWPQEWVSANYQKLFSRQTAPLWEIAIPFTSKVFAVPATLPFHLVLPSCRQRMPLISVLLWLVLHLQQCRSLSCSLFSRSTLPRELQWVL